MLWDFYVSTISVAAKVSSVPIFGYSIIIIIKKSRPNNIILNDIIYVISFGIWRPYPSFTLHPFAFTEKKESGLSANKSVTIETDIK